MRKIIHIDMDCFYAAVEMVDRPALREVPLAVGGLDRRSVICTCNYRAREYGVRSAMPTFMALERCPDLVIVPVRFGRYREISAGIREIFFQYTDLVEPLSLDEAYLDVSAHSLPGTEIASRIREEIRSTFGLSSSAGIAPNKLLAKIASDWRKPDGQFVVRPKDVDKFMMDLPVRRIPGVGPKAEERLIHLGCRTCGDLQKIPPETLQNALGRFGIHLHSLCRGQDESPVEPVRIRKSLSNERTYSEFVEDHETLTRRIAELHEDLLVDLAAHTDLLERIAGVFVKVKFDDFRQTTLSRRAGPWDLETCQQMAIEAFDRMDRPARLLGIGVRFRDDPSYVAEQMELPLGRG